MSAHQDLHASHDSPSDPDHSDGYLPDTHPCIIDRLENAITQHVPSNTRTALNPDHDSRLGPDAAEGHLSSRIHPPNSIVEGPAPNESHQVPTRMADEGTSLQTTSDQAANSSLPKPSPPPPEPQSSPGSSHSHSEPEEISPDRRTPSTDPQQLGVELHSQLPPALQRLVSPLFVEPYSNPSSVPTSYQPRLTSAFFREAFREEYDQYIESKPKDSLPSLLDLEMMVFDKQINSSLASLTCCPGISPGPKSLLTQHGSKQGFELAVCFKGTNRR